ncbi:MAG: hypothetical protein AB9873_16330 [Syntrophobacteraceae bacterium]
MNHLVSPKISVPRLALLIAAMTWAALVGPRSSCFGASEVPGQACPDEDSPTAVGQITEDPEAHVGCRLVVRGTLYRMQGVDQILYSIRLDSGESLEVRSWAPDERAPGQRREDPSEDSRDMPSYVGQELRIEGKLVRERDGRVVLEASIVEQLGGTSE